MEKQTLYIGIEVDAKAQGRTTPRIITVLDNIKKEGYINQYEVFLCDDQPLQETKKILSGILYEIVKARTMTDSVVKFIESAIEKAKNTVGIK